MIENKKRRKFIFTKADPRMFVEVGTILQQDWFGPHYHFIGTDGGRYHLNYRVVEPDFRNLEEIIEG